MVSMTSRIICASSGLLDEIWKTSPRAWPKLSNSVSTEWPRLRRAQISRKRRCNAKNSMAGRVSDKTRRHCVVRESCGMRSTAARER